MAVPTRKTPSMTVIKVLQRVEIEVEMEDCAEWEVTE